jgi:GNAT superfamily N-acetyltransferase
LFEDDLTSTNKNDITYKGENKLLKIIDFTERHIEQAIYIAKDNYENERKCINILPVIDELPDFSPFAENGLGVSAFDGEKMVGYLCCFDPCENAFGTTNDIGVYSPIYGNGIIEGNHIYTFARMYQEAAKKWVSLGATNHAMTFYAHNKYLQNQLYRYGFGLRCIDAIRAMKEVDVKENSQFVFSELEHNEFHLIFTIGLLLDAHLRNSPMFMCYSQDKIEAGHEYKFAEWQIREKIRYFVVKDNGKIIAYIKISDEGENFVSELDSVINICGAYCLPEYRGQGILQNLLNYLIKKLRNENYQLLGVDYESFNPTASGFWLKYFTEYTQSVVRRVDDRYIK